MPRQMSQSASGEQVEVRLVGLGGVPDWMADLEEVLASPQLGLRCGAIESVAAACSEISATFGDAPTLRLLVVAVAAVETSEAAELLHDWAARSPGPPIMVAVDRARPEQIFELLEAGAADFVSPPFDRSQVLPRIRRLLEHGQASPERPWKRRLRTEMGLRRLIGESSAFREEVGKIPLVAKCDVSVMICGETGTGKDLVARAIHYLSPRSGRSFVAVNCGAIPVDLLENELFGHGRAAFTGATTASPGLIREAEGGTLFLDEIDSMPVASQVKSTLR